MKTKISKKKFSKKVPETCGFQGWRDHIAKKYYGSAVEIDTTDEVKGKPCKICMATTLYSEKYDAFYCSRCNEWNEKTCRSKDFCEFCAKRPERPLYEKV